MKLSAKLKTWLVANMACKADATDEVFQKAAGEAFATGKLTPVAYQDMTKEADGGANQFLANQEALVNGITKLTDLLSKGMTPAGTGTLAPASAPAGEVKAAEIVPPAPIVEKAKPSAAHLPAWYGGMVKALGTDGENVETYTKEGTVRVKGPHERYATTRKGLVHPATTKAGKVNRLAGLPVFDFAEHGKQLDEASELDKAVAGVYAKFCILTSMRGGSRTFGFQGLPQHEKELLWYALEEMEWGGSTDGGDKADIAGRKLTPSERKALIDDATSGGIEAAPIVFDDQVIQAPLLHSELFNLVNLKPLDRGRRVEGVSTAKVTGSWGGIDDTAITLFNTASYVSAFDTTIFRWQGAVKIGLDFMSDTPIDFGAHFTEQYGERLLEDLDDVVAAGNGTTQPEGIINKSGATSVSFGGVTSLGNYESLRFGVTKAEHKGVYGNSAVFCGTETSYMRARALPVGASDARRLGGMDYSSYRWMERDYKINESLTNAQIFYAIMQRYRMYRRRGLTIRTSTEGDTLIRANEMVIAVTARYGGQMERGAAVAYTTTAPA